MKEAFSGLNQEPDIMLLDVMLPDGNGIDFCRVVHEKTLAPDYYFVCT